MLPDRRAEIESDIVRWSEHPAALAACEALEELLVEIDRLSAEPVAPVQDEPALAVQDEGRDEAEPLGLKVELNALDPNEAWIVSRNPDGSVLDAVRIVGVEPEPVPAAPPVPATPSYDDWTEATKTIREWLNGGGVATDVLAAELAAALAQITAHSIVTPAPALNDEDLGRIAFDAYREAAPPMGWIAVARAVRTALDPENGGQ
jgi:hypothetical protein